jgi:hypothetical protein
MIECAINTGYLKRELPGGRGRKESPQNRNVFFLQMIVCAGNKGNAREGRVGGEGERTSQGLKIFPSTGKRVIWIEMHFCTCFYPSPGNSYLDINVMIWDR